MSLLLMRFPRYSSARRILLMCTLLISTTVYSAEPPNGKDSTKPATTAGKISTLSGD